MGFLESKYLYLGVLIFTISYPLFQSFEWRISFYKNWKPLFLSCFVMMLVFIPWDIWFASQSVWWFRKEYILGVEVFHLPIEEWLFFIIVPYACVFIYEVLNFYVKKDILISIAKPFYLVFGLLLLISTALYFPRYYTSITFGTAGLACLIIAFTGPRWAGRFLLTYFVSFIPFVLVNGALTGSFTKFPIVNYNAREIIGFRIFTIPVEDSVYNFLMLLIVISFFEKYRVFKTY
tara:strand:+ start:18131 stop:18832 length:702 start_codon:yes stop_codon:yes gene_type:complete